MKNIIKKYKKQILILLFSLFFCIEILAMKEIISIPKVLGINSFGIRTYGLLITSAVLLVSYLIHKEIIQDKELKKMDVTDMLIIALVFGLIGARLYHLATDWYLYQEDPVSALFLWNGGMGIFGAVLGGAFGLWIYTKRKHYRLLPLLDVVAVFMPLAQVIGRAGNLINQEIIGITTDLPWSWKITGLSGNFHPVFLYEQIGNLFLFILLLWFYKKKKWELGKGVLLLIYVLGYCIVRFIVEFFRLESRILFDVFSINQLVCMMVILGSSSILMVKYKKASHKSNNNK